LYKIFTFSVSNGFLTYLGDEETKLRFESEVILDPNTGKEIDFVHMIAPLNAYLKNGDKVMYIVSTDYAGWAGDLITLLEEVTKYRIENNIEDVEELQEYCNSLLGTNKPSSCSSSDILADLDAISLYKDSSNKITEDLYNALYKYYVSKDSTYNANNRLSSTQTILGTKENVKNKAQVQCADSAITFTTEETHVMSAPEISEAIGDGDKTKLIQLLPGRDASVFVFPSTVTSSIATVSPSNVSAKSEAFASPTA